MQQEYAGMCSKGVHFESFVDVNVPTSVSMDALRVRQVLANGITNALKLTSHGHVVIQACGGNGCAYVFVYACACA